MVTTPNFDLDTDTTLGGSNASDYTIASQKAIKSYVDNSTGSTVDQTFDPTSINAQSGVAIEGAGFLKNTATYSPSTSITILGTSATSLNGINIGYNSQSSGDDGTAIGYRAKSTGETSTALGSGAEASGMGSIGLGAFAKATKGASIQLGGGTNSTANSLQVWSYPLLDKTTGYIFDDRISSNIARTSAIPDVSNFVTNTSLATTLSSYATQSWVGQQGYITGITSSDVITALGYTPYNSTNPNGYQANVIETIKVNNTAQTVTSKAVNITVPTNTNQLTNGAGFITSSALSPYALSSSLATVATSGDYNDLSNKPYIPSGVVVDQTYDGTSANAQSGVAIEGELANYVKGQNGSITISNTGIDATILYIDDASNPQELYGVDVGQTSGGNGVVFVAANMTTPAYYMAILTPTGFGISDMVNNQTALLTVSNNNLAVNGSEIATQSDLSSLADTDLSNLSATGKAVIDGAFVSSVRNIIENGTINANTTTSAYSLSSYLPNDSHTYEIFGDITGQTSSTSGQYVTFFVGMSGETAVRVASALTRTSSTMVAAGYFSGFVNSTRAINVTNTGTSKASGVTLRLLGYRRVGTNA